MEQQKERIKLSAIKETRLPFGYKEIHTEKIPPLQVEAKLMLYNNKFAFRTMQILCASKPISKIIQ